MRAGIIILNYNDSSTTTHLVDTIKGFMSLNKIIIVDNCSTDNSYSDLIKLRSDKIDVIMSDRNGGYAYGNNFGIKYGITNYGLDIVFIANPDIKFDEQVIERIIEEFRQTDYAVLSARMINADNSPSNQGWNLPSYTDDILNSSALISKLIKPRKKQDLIDYSKPIVDVEVLSGSFFAIRTDVMKAIDYFDEGTFLYCEERILGKKLKDVGHKTGILTDIQYIHIHGSSIKRSINALSMRKILFKSRIYYQENYNQINSMQKYFLVFCMSISLMVYGVYLKLEEIIYKITRDSKNRR